MTSGDKYSAVPHILFASLSPLTPSFDSPKSVNLMKPSESTRTFSGFKLYNKLSVFKNPTLYIIYCVDANALGLRKHLMHKIWLRFPSIVLFMKGSRIALLLGSTLKRKRAWCLK